MSARRVKKKVIASTHLSPPGCCQPRWSSLRFGDDDLPSLKRKRKLWGNLQPSYPPESVRTHPIRSWGTNSEPGWYVTLSYELPVSLLEPIEKMLTLLQSVIPQLPYSQLLITHLNCRQREPLHHPHHPHPPSYVTLGTPHPRWSFNPLWYLIVEIPNTERVNIIRLWS